MAKVTFIMSVLNTRHEWIKRAIDSIIVQTSPEWKLILVDDGSSLETADYCEKVAGMDDRIILHHQANKGLSTARNYGMDNADTPWVTFIDADDWLEATCVEQILDILDKHKELEVLAFGHDDIYGEKVMPQLWGDAAYYKFNISDKLGMQMALLQNPEGLQQYPMFFGGQWKMWYSLEFLNKYGIRNDPEVLKAQDSVFNLYVTEYAKEIGYYNIVLYHYFHNDESVTGAKFNRNTEKLIVLLKAYKKFVDETGKSEIETYCNAYKKMLLLQFESMLEKTFLNENNSDKLKEKTAEIKQILTNEPYISALKKYDSKGLSAYRKILFYCMKNGWNYCILLLFVMKVWIKK